MLDTTVVAVAISHYQRFLGHALAYTSTVAGNDDHSLLSWTYSVTVMTVKKNGINFFRYY